MFRCTSCCSRVHQAARCATSRQPAPYRKPLPFTRARLPKPPFPVAQNVHRIGHLQAEKNTASQDVIALGDFLSMRLAAAELPTQWARDFMRISGAKGT